MLLSDHVLLVHTQIDHLTTNPILLLVLYLEESIAQGIQQIAGTLQGTCQFQMGVNPKIGVGPQNGWFTMETPIKMDDLGGGSHIFGNTQNGAKFFDDSILHSIRDHLKQKKNQRLLVFFDGFPVGTPVS